MKHVLTAQQPSKLIRRCDLLHPLQRSQVLSTRGEGDAVDLVLQRLGDLEYPDFVLSCRVADWRSATNASAITEQYEDEKLLVLHLEPLTTDDIRQLLATELANDSSRADAVIRHFREANLDGLLKNPQTLKMVATVARKGALPSSRAELFERAVEELRKEHRDDRADLQVDEETALDAAGAAFASLILTGSDALVLQEANLNEDEILLAETAALPGAHRLEKILGSRLFATAGAASRFSYWHRSIGEYLGSRNVVELPTTWSQPAQPRLPRCATGASQDDIDTVNNALQAYADGGNRLAALPSNVISMINSAASTQSGQSSITQSSVDYYYQYKYNPSLSALRTIDINNAQNGMATDYSDNSGVIGLLVDVNNQYGTTIRRELPQFIAGTSFGNGAPDLNQSQTITIDPSNPIPSIVQFMVSTDYFVNNPTAELTRYNK